MLGMVGQLGVHVRERDMQMQFPIKKEVPTDKQKSSPRKIEYFRAAPATAYIVVMIILDITLKRNQVSYLQYY